MPSCWVIGLDSEERGGTGTGSDSHPMIRGCKRSRSVEVMPLLDGGTNKKFKAVLAFTQIGCVTGYIKAGCYPSKHIKNSQLLGSEANFCLNAQLTARGLKTSM